MWFDLVHFKNLLFCLLPLFPTSRAMVAGLQEEADCRPYDLVLMLYYLNACLCSISSLTLSQGTKFGDGPAILEATSSWKAQFKLSVILI